MKKNSILKNIVFILVAGMGNVKQGNWQCILIYFCFIILLGFGLVFAEQKIIEQYFHPSQTMRIFLILIYIAFAFFWNGTNLLDSDEKSFYFDHDEGIPCEKNQGGNQKWTKSEMPNLEINAENDNSLSKKI